MGRPPHPEPVTRKSIALPDTLWDAVSDYRHGQHIPSEAEAVRRLVQAGLDAEAKRAARKARR